jgi:uncharacterized protein (TIGR02466 family)
MSTPKLIDVTPFEPVIIKVHYDGWDWNTMKTVCQNMIDESPVNAGLETDGGKSSVYNVKNQPHNNPAFRPFYTWLTPIVNHLIFKEWKLMQDYEYSVGNSWVNVHPKGGITSEHHHGPAVIVAAAYLQLPKDSGFIQFKDPLEYVKGFHTKQDSRVAEYYTVPAVTGDVFLFPGWLRHRTEHSNSDEDRWVLTTNIMNDHKPTIYKK